jgi:cytidyltransferase-like protein
MASGYFSGRFDPIHFGHRDAVGFALDWGLKKVYVDPVFVSPTKPCMAGYEHRFRLAELMFRKLAPGVAVIKQDYTMYARTGRAPTNTERLNEMATSCQEELFWITTNDALSESEIELKDMLKYAKVLTMERAGRVSTISENKEVVVIDKTVGGSSSQIRESLALGESVSYGLPPDIIGHIHKNRLYVDHDV